MSILDWENPFSSNVHFYKRNTTRNITSVKNGPKFKFGQTLDVAEAQFAMSADRIKKRIQVSEGKEIKVGRDLCRANKKHPSSVYLNFCQW